MPDRHAQNPISIRPPRDDRAWLEAYAAQAGRTVHVVIIEAIARERARQETGTADIAARARQLAEDGVRSAEAQALARELLRQLADRLDSHAAAQTTEENHG